MRHRIIAILLLIFTAATNQAFAQSVEGVWYTPLRNKLLSVVITGDSILFKKCSFDDPKQDYGYTEKAFKIEKKINTNCIASSLKDTVTMYYLLGFRIDKKSMRNDLNIESLDNTYLTLADAENAIADLEQQPLKIRLLKKQEIDRIKKSRDLSKMTASDFKHYAEKIIQADSMNAAYLKKMYKLSYLYIESNGRIMLSETGFNSLVKGNVFDTMMEKFSENKATKEIFIKMSGGR